MDDRRKRPGADRESATGLFFFCHAAAKRDSVAYNIARARWTSWAPCVKPEFIVAALRKMTNEDHNRYLGYSFLGYAALHLFSIAAMFGMMFFFFTSLPAQPGRDMPPWPFPALVFGFIALFSLFFTVPPAVAAYGLLKHKSWSRIAGIVAGVLAGMSFPVGTAICVYALWFLLGSGRDLYEASRGTIANPALSSGSDTNWVRENRETKEEEWARRAVPPDWR